MQRKPALIVLALCALPLIPSPALAGGSLYWYNGDPDFAANLINENGLFFGSALAYDDFVVGAGGVEITGVLSNDSIQANTGQGAGNAGVSSVVGLSTATWQIRSGVSAGNGGTLFASGDGAATFSDTGHFLGGEIYRVEVDGLNLSLAAGTYWLTVAPDIASSMNSFIDRTAGVNGAGSPIAHDGNSFLASGGLGYDFTTAGSLINVSAADGGFVDLSEGLVGVAIAAAPEPGTGLFGIAAALLTGVVGFARKWRNGIAQGVR